MIKTQLIIVALKFAEFPDHTSIDYGAKGLTGLICPSRVVNPFPPRPTKADPIVVLLCLTPDYFTYEGGEPLHGKG